MNHNREAKSLTCWRVSEVSQGTFIDMDEEPWHSLRRANASTGVGR